MDYKGRYDIKRASTNIFKYILCTIVTAMYVTNNFVGIF